MVEWSITTDCKSVAFGLRGFESLPTHIVCYNHKMQPYCYLNGEIIPLDQAKVSVTDIGMMRGYGIYEGITTANNKPFYLEEHLDRFERSAKALGLRIPLSRARIAEILNELVKKNGYRRTNFRVILTGGPAEGGVNFNPETPTFYIVTEEHHRLPEETYTNGASLIRREHLRFLPEIKTINYINAVRLQPERKQAGAIEILFTYQGRVLEAATSNLFIFKGDRLITPKKDVLIGITRNIVLDLAKNHFKIEEHDILESELAEASEVFISASYKDIVPIIRIDDLKIGGGKVGKNTKQILALFGNLIKNY